MLTEGVFMATWDSEPCSDHEPQTRGMRAHLPCPLLLIMQAALAAPHPPVRLPAPNSPVRSVSLAGARWCTAAHCSPGCSRSPAHAQHEPGQGEWGSVRQQGAWNTHPYSRCEKRC